MKEENMPNNSSNLKYFFFLKVMFCAVYSEGINEALLCSLDVNEI
jgi:hypothetical protein